MEQAQKAEVSRAISKVKQIVAFILELNWFLSASAALLLFLVMDPFGNVRAGFEGSVVVNDVRKAKKNHGLNADTGEIVDLVAAGVIDPAMVTRSALQNAASIGKNILTTEAIVAEAPDGKTASMEIDVTHYDEPRSINFAGEVVPVFTKYGCNGGGCHGKSGGQNGFRLSLLGFYPEDDYEVETELPGSALVGMRYVPPFPSFVERLGPDAAWRVVAADFVTTEDGTGVVHIAPAYGADDSVLGKAEGLPVLNPLRPDGRFDDTLEMIAGDWFKDADKKIVRDLRDRERRRRRRHFRLAAPALAPV